MNKLDDKVIIDRKAFKLLLQSREGTATYKSALLSINAALAQDLTGWAAVLVKVNDKMLEKGE